MIRLYDNDTNAILGTVTEEELQFLIDQLEEENEEDKDYYINKATLDLLEKNGADTAFLEMLKRAMGDREEMEIRWARS